MLLERIRENCRQFPGKPAYLCGDERLTYGDLWDQACRLAAALRADRGPVLVYGHKSAAVPVSFLACALAGRAYLPCDVSTPPQRLRGIWQASGAKQGIACEPLPFALPGVEPFSALLQRGTAQPCLPPARPGRDFYLLFTSGSTGAPKGVRVTLGNVEHFVAWFLALPAIAACADGVCVNQAQFSFDLSVADLWPTWAAGGTVYALPGAVQAQLPALYRALAQSGGARLTATPSFLRLCLCDPAFGRQTLPALQAIFSCGEILPPRTVRSLHKRLPGVRVLNAYGPTEATCAVCAVEIEPGQAEGDVLPVGRLADAAADIEIAGQGQAPGEICLAGPSVAAGYVNTEAGGFFERGGAAAYRTGDAGYRKDGYLWYVGRLDRQIKYKGYRIEPGEIEAVLDGWPEIRQAAVLPVWGGATVRALAACICWQGQPLPQQVCRQRLAQTLPAYMLPRRYLSLEDFPLTANGKCDYRRLEELLQLDG